MPSEERLLAWIQPRGGDCLASFVAESSVHRRAPATRRCASRDEARLWLMQEAAAVGASVEWLAEEPNAIAHRADVDLVPAGRA